MRGIMNLNKYAIRQRHECIDPVIVIDKKARSAHSIPRLATPILNIRQWSASQEPEIQRGSINRMCGGLLFGHVVHRLGAYLGSGV